MQNVTFETKGEKLIITVDTKKRLGASKSGKTISIASTQGNQPAPGMPHVIVGLNVYTKQGVGEE